MRFFLSLFVSVCCFWAMESRRIFHNFAEKSASSDKENAQFSFLVENIEISTELLIFVTTEISNRIFRFSANKTLHLPTFRGINLLEILVKKRNTEDARFGVCWGFPSFTDHAHRFILILCQWLLVQGRGINGEVYCHRNNGQLHRDNSTPKWTRIEHNL